MQGGIQCYASAETWQAICLAMQAEFSKSAFQSGALKGISAVAEALGSHFPSSGAHINELPDAPVLLT